MRDQHGNKSSVIGVARDITDRKQAEAKLQETNDHLEKTLKELENTQAQLIHAEKMASLGQMVAGIAHEINNPIGFVYGNLEFIKNLLDQPRKLSDTSEHKEDMTDALHSAMTGAKRIGEIVQNLKTFSKLDEEEHIETDINQDIDTILDLFIKQHDDITIKKQYTDHLHLTCYVKQLNQCFLNILVNAVQAIRDAENENLLAKVSGLISITTEPPATDGQSSIRIIISDNGIDIPKQNTKKIFDPFFTTRLIGQGKGLGLSEAYGIIQRHKGQIEVRSEEKKGSEFIITIPIEPD